MFVRLALEDIEPDHWIAWAVDLPGCFSAAANAHQAVVKAPRKVAEHFLWLSQHDCSLPVVTAAVEGLVPSPASSTTLLWPKTGTLSTWAMDWRVPISLQNLWKNWNECAPTRGKRCLGSSAMSAFLEIGVSSGRLQSGEAHIVARTRSCAAY